MYTSLVVIPCREINPHIIYLINTLKYFTFKAKMLDQLDEEFGIGNLVREEIHSARNTAYTEKDLKGLKVEHNVVSVIIRHTFLYNSIMTILFDVIIIISTESRIEIIHYYLLKYILHSPI